MGKEHHFNLTTFWQDTDGQGTANVRKYSRNHTVSINGKPDQHLTTDNAAVGDKSKLNPEDLLVTAISSCYMLSYLYLCSLEGIVVHNYIDHASGIMIEQKEGGGQFKEVTLNPEVIVTDDSMIERAIELHHKAHEICYIANSVNFEVKCIPVCKIMQVQ